MKIKVMFFSILFSLSLVAQNQIDSNGKKQGPWKKTHPKSTAIMYEGQFKDDKPVGTFFYYYPSKSKQAIIVHDAKSNRSTAIFSPKCPILRLMSSEIVTSGSFRKP